MSGGMSHIFVSFRADRVPGGILRGIFPFGFSTLAAYA
jgi:hypothetical protein